MSVLAWISPYVIFPAHDPSMSAFVAGAGAWVEGLSAASAALVDATLETPLAGSLTLLLASILFCWIGNCTTGYWSYVDRLWSTVPMAFAAIFAYHAGWAHPRVLLVTALIAAWGVRLTLNFWRKGGYSSEEDYRWPVLRTWFKVHDPLHPFGQELFSFLFVSVYQLVLIWGFVVPPLVVVAGTKCSALTAADAALAALFIVFLALETWTDEVQWAFQSAKHAMTPAARARAGGDFARGFCTSGPFRYSRHLNFFSEQCIWWCIYGFAALSAGGRAPLWAGVGALLLTSLFQGSTWMTELLTLHKYPACTCREEREEEEEEDHARPPALQLLLVGAVHSARARSGRGAGEGARCYIYKDLRAAV